MTRPVPVLMYHAVSDQPTQRCKPLAVRPRDLAGQFAHLRGQGFTALTASALAAVLRGAPGAELPERPVVITFDDGYAGFHAHALPALERYGLTATLFVTTDWLAGGPRAGSPPDEPMLTWSQVADAAGRGVEIGGHTRTHPELDQLPAPALRAEVADSKARLEDELQRPVRSLAYPFGYSDARVRQVVREAGYDNAWAVANALPRPGGDQFTLPRLTIGWDTSMDTFADVVACRQIDRIYLKQRTLTKGKAVLRRSRAAAGRVTGRVTGRRRA